MMAADGTMASNAAHHSPQRYRAIEETSSTGYSKASRNSARSGTVRPPSLPLLAQKCDQQTSRNARQRR